MIESADILFGPGFNALTGETGAGKSIVIDAMGAVLGGRTSRDLIRTGAAKAFVSAEFSSVPAELPGLQENGVPLTRTGTCCSSGKSPATARTPAGPMDGPSPWPSCGRSARPC